MPENSMKQKQQRPTSDILLETGRKLLTEVEKSAVADSNKHVSMLLARSRSLDILSSTSDKLTQCEPDKNLVTNKDGPLHTNSIGEEDKDFEQMSIYMANSCLEAASSNQAESSNDNNLTVKDEPLLKVGTNEKKSNLTLLKEKSELNNNRNTRTESYQSNTNRSSCSSSISTTSSNYSVTSSSNHHKPQRRSSSTLEGAAAFQEVVLKTEPIRITGYLEKRSKVLGWKKFWFVLDGRLLTYYKSKADYESLSACCGCINLGIASTVRPIQIRGCKGYPLQIVTRSQVYYLRSQEKPILEQWLIAIQEASSSPPSTSVLTSWNSYSGSQYFKQSLSSQSQWSLNNSSDDITNITDRLGNLPDTFYQRRDRNSLALTNPPPVIHKYHSFASLQTPIINDFSDRRNILIASSENLRDLRDVNRKPNRKSNSGMQNSTSLLVLDSSPQAAELRKELTRKLSIGSAKKCYSGGVQDEDDGAVPAAKFLISSAKKKLELGQCTEDESHDYAEIGEFIEGGKRSKPYENCDVEKSTTGNSGPVHQSADNRNLNRGESAEKESNIYEHVETMDLVSSSQTCTPAVIWEPLNEGNNTICNNKRFPLHRMSATSNRNSLVSICELPEDLSSISPSPIKTPILSSIPESSWRSGIEPYKNCNQNYSEDDLSSCRSESFRSLPCVEKSGKKRRGKAFSGFLSKVFGKNKGKGSKSESLENLPRPMVISGPVDLRNREMQETKPEILHKQPVCTSGAVNVTTTNRNDPNNKDQQQSVVKTSPVMAGSRMTINNTIVMDELKQRVGHIMLKRTNSKESSSDRESESPPKEVVHADKLPQNPTKPEPRVPYVPRGNSITSIPPSTSKHIPVLILQTESKSFESNTDDDTLVAPTKPQKEIQVASICMSPENDTPLPEDEHEDIKPQDVKLVGQTKTIQPQPTNKSSSTDVDFQNKLAKFNRLSQKLNASFNPAAINPLFNANNHIGRSNSCKTPITKGKGPVEVIPPLPPKKKNAVPGGGSGTIAIYDVPLNNKPVRKSESFKLTSRDSLRQNEEPSIAAYIRGITKKNSTPDIVISGNNAKLFGLSDDDPHEFRRALIGNSEDNLEVHKSNPSLPPPRPPKPKPPTKPKSLELGLSRSKRSSESSSASSETITEPHCVNPTLPSFPMQSLLLAPEIASPATSSKSLDIDTLDALSDTGLSDTKASDSPPDSPKICPLHPESHSQDDLSLSTIARTPDSLITISDGIVPDSLIGTPDTEIFQPALTPLIDEPLPEVYPGIAEPISINKLEIVIHDNDGSPDLALKSPDNESRMDSLERSNNMNMTSIAPKNANMTDVYQNIKFATVSTLIQEFETVQENEEEISELYDDFPAEFYTPTPSSFSGYSPSEISSTSTDSTMPLSTSSSSPSVTCTNKKHAAIDAIRNSGMEQLEAFLSFGSSSDDCSFASCTDNFPEENATKAPFTSPATAIPINNNNNINVKAPQQFHAQTTTTPATGMSRTGAISRLGHSSAIGHLQKILTSDAK